jgi:hypothetical protein
MNGETPGNRDNLLETFVAELTLAAYQVALRTRTQGTWLDLELGLWRVVAEKVKTWGQDNWVACVSPALRPPPRA